LDVLIYFNTLKFNTMFKYTLILLSFLFIVKTNAQRTYSERMTATIMRENADSLHYVKEAPNKRAPWTYENGVILKGIEQLWERTGNGDYLRYMQKMMDFFVAEDGSVRDYDLDEYNSDHVTPGRICLTLYSVLGKDKYKKAADLMRSQLKTHPRTKEGGFWHKQIYPNQMWLDGLYMVEPFYAEYSMLFKEDNWDDIANQFVWMETHARDAKTGLLYHGWDASKEQQWANKETGTSPHFWDRSMGWYAMALVDVLDYFPKNHPKRGELIAILQRTMEAVVKVQDTEGVWWQVMDRIGDKGNYREASGSCMFVYALAKGVRLGYLDKKYVANAERGYAGILKHFITENPDGSVNLEKTVRVSGLGGKPYRDGSYEYYLSEKIRQNDLKGVGPFIMASVEMETAKEAQIGKGKTVLLDYFFNNEYRKGFDGQLERYHYTLNERRDGGFQLWGKMFTDMGATIQPLVVAPSVSNLKNANVYIIVDPDTKKETEKPNFMTAEYVKTIKNWVKKGGTLILMANDTSNCEITQFNTLSKAFGIEFTNKCRNFVKNDTYPQGEFFLSENHPIFKDVKRIFIKEFSVLNVQKPAQGILFSPDNTSDAKGTTGDIIMATAQYGKGRVFAIGDPWIYNEYIGGRKLPNEYENFKAAKYLAQWLLK
jgi:unsaturated rhamnogalacturonyl hydrolase